MQTNKESINKNLEKYQNKYRIKSARKEGYDYSQNGWYFLTIVTKNREHYFGEIINNEMKYSDIGNVALECWKGIPKHFPFVTLDEFIVMPNHIHGIIEIDKPVETQNLASLRENASLRANASLWANDHKNKFGPQSKNLASIIRGFKIGVTKYARQNTEIYTIWQSRFYDRIIRDEIEYIKIKNYIINNPLNWDTDKNNI